MKTYTEEEIEQSINDKDLSQLIIMCLFTHDINIIKKSFIEQNRIELASYLTSNLEPEAQKKFYEKNIIDDEGISVLGLAHIQMYFEIHTHLQKEQAVKSENTTETDNEEDVLKSIIALSLSKFNLNELEELFEAKKHKYFTYYLTKNLNNEGTQKLISSNIITLDNTITTKGWDLIEWYIKTNGNSNKQDRSSKTTTKKRNWWEFWK